MQLCSYCKLSQSPTGLTYSIYRIHPIMITTKIVVNHKELCFQELLRVQSERKFHLYTVYTLLRTDELSIITAMR